jgi:hypothetical protein
MAHLVQRPDDKLGVSMILQGGRGYGKTLLMSKLAHRIGANAFIAGNNNLLTGNFNSHLRGRLLLVVEESFWSGNHKDRGVLQHMITDSITAYEKKGFDAEAGVSYLRVCMITNEEWAVPAAIDERRYFLPTVCAASKERDIEGGTKGHFFPALINEIDNGGMESFLYDMATRDISKESLRTVPETAKLQDQKLLSLDWIDKWFLHTLTDGVISARNMQPVPWTRLGCRISMRALGEALRDGAPYAANHSEKGLATAFGLRVKKVFGRDSYTRVSGIDGASYIFFDIEGYRKKFAKYVGLELEWPTETSSTANPIPYYDDLRRH